MGLLASHYFLKYHRKKSDKADRFWDLQAEYLHTPRVRSIGPAKVSATNTGGTESWTDSNLTTQTNPGIRLKHRIIRVVQE